MNFDKESKSEDFFCGGGGGGGRGGSWGQGGNGEEISNRKIINRYSLIFCAHALYKISSSK